MNIERARKLSLYYQYELHPRWGKAVSILIQKGELIDLVHHYHDDTFVAAVADWQRKVGLNSDGVIGPKTVEYILNDMNQTDGQIASDSILYAGERIPVSGLKNGIVHDLKMRFELHPNCYKFRNGDIPVTKVVWHWDVSLSSHACYQTLIQRGLSVHFLIDGDGTVYQTLDLSFQADHTVGFDEGSIGIEINNPYWIKRQKDSRIPRPIIGETLPNGQGFQEHLGFTPEQVMQVVALAQALSDTFGIPKVLPAGGKGSPRDDSGVCLDKCVDSSYSGHCGHYHVQKNKIDPGTSLWPFFKNSGFSIIGDD